VIWRQENKVIRNVAGELLFAKKNVVAKLALLLKACGSAVRDARRKWRDEICNIAKRYAEPCQQKPLAYKVIWRQGDKITSPVG